MGRLLGIAIGVSALAASATGREFAYYPYSVANPAAQATEFAYAGYEENLAAL